MFKLNDTHRQSTDNGENLKDPHEDFNYDWLPDYESFWNESRSYEDAVERIALRRLLAGLGGSCIDIGCGYGRLLNEYVSQMSEILLLDVSACMLDIAQKRISDAGFQNVGCVKGSLYELEALGRKFDTAISVRVLHHVGDVPYFFTEVNRILPMGGHFILEYANKRNILEIFRYLTHRPNLGPFEHTPSDRGIRKSSDILYNNYHPAYIRELIKQAGFKVEETLTVSLFRNDRLKKLFGWERLSAMEKNLQKPFAFFTPGPSVFLRLQKSFDV